MGHPDQSHLFDSLVRRSFRSDVQRVIYIQSCIRRRLARKELKVLKTEARSASKFKEISYKLENKVVELTQTLQARTAEKKELQGKLTEVERQLAVWMTRHEEVDGRAKQLQAELQTGHVPKSRFEELLETKEGVDARLAESTRKIAEQEEEIQRLSTEISRQISSMEERKKTYDDSAQKTAEITPAYAALKEELANVREQLNRANALNSLTKGSRAEPPSPGLKSFDTFQNGLIHPSASNGSVNINGSGPPPVTRHQRRHSSAGIHLTDSMGGLRDSADQLMLDVKRNQNPRAVSVAFNGGDHHPRFRGSNLGSLYDDPAEEKVKLLEDADRLDEDVLQGLIRGLKIPSPSLPTPPSVKEVLFPANLIALITNEMWKFGLIPESERFLANVMQTIQGHVMVSYHLSSQYKLSEFTCL